MGPFIYLGSLLSERRSRKSNFDFVLDKIYGKLAGWKWRYLSQAGRLILLQSVLDTTPLYLLSNITVVPWSIIDRIQRIYKSFFRATKLVNRRVFILYLWMIYVHLDPREVWDCLICILVIDLYLLRLLTMNFDSL